MEVAACPEASASQPAQPETREAALAPEQQAASRPGAVIGRRELQDCEALRARLEAGALEVDTRLGRRRRTLLHVAVLSFRPDLVELLLEFSADPLLEDTTGHTPYSLCNELREAARAGGAEMDEAPLAARLDSIADLLEYPVAMQSLFYVVSMGPDSCGGKDGMAPPGPSPLLRLTSTGKRVRPLPLPRPPGKPTRGTSIEGATQATAGTDLAAAQAALSHRLEQGVQIFSDVGLWCLLSLQERDNEVSSLPKDRARPVSSVAKAQVCGICFEASSEELVTAPCGFGNCSGRFCKGCLTTHVQHSVGELRYALPLVRCPECRRRVPTRVWEPLLTQAGASEVPSRIMTSAQALLKVRCPSCHTPRDLFEFEPSTATDGEAELSLCGGVLGGLPHERRLLVAKQAMAFRRGALAEALLDALETEEERAPAGGSSALPHAPPTGLEGRFRHLCRLLGDVERSTALQLAFYRRYPLIHTPCCNAKMCFKCKVKGHHEGQTCDARQAQELSIEAQFCPGCGVPTVKSEGCNHIVCVCGASWTWRTEADSW